MSLPELCIRRPVMTTLLMLSFVVFGVFGYAQLPVSALPAVDFPTISVSANLAGANPETMASSVAAPLEQAFANIPGIALMTSRSTSGFTNIVLQFDLNRAIDGAALDVQSEISATLRKLPSQMTTPPSFREVNPADAPILFLILSSPTLPLSTVDDYAEQVFANQISQIPGVALVTIFGQQQFAVRIDANSDAAAARGLTITDIGNAVANANSANPVGGLLGQRGNVTLATNGQLRHAEDYKPIVIAFRNGAPIRLQDVADVYDSTNNNQTAAWYGKNRSIVMAITRQSDANTVATVDAIRAKLPTYQLQLPPSVNVNVLNDRSISIRQSVSDVQFTLTISIILVILVIFLFLKSVSATLIPALALPVSLIGTCGFMFLFGYSIDNISLLAVTLAVGFVVDDAIVMLENISRHIEHGMRPFDAALKGSKEIGFTIVSITLSLCAVFIPVLLMGGIVGRVFHEFAVTISCAILVSGFVSLTLTPMLCARILKPIDHNAKQSLFGRISDTVVGGLTNGYAFLLDRALKFRFIMLFVTFATIFFSVSMFSWIPKGFFPIEDTGIVTGSTQAQAGTSFPVMAQLQQRVAEIVMADPAVDYLTSQAASTTGNLFIVLKDKSVRSPVAQVIARIRRETADIPGINLVMQPVQNLNFNGGRAARAAYQYTLQSGDTTTLYSIAPKMLAKLQQLPELRDASSDLQITNPQLYVDVDQEKAAAYGLTNAQIQNALYAAYGTQQISTIYTPLADYEVILETSRDFQDDPSKVGSIYLRSTPTGGASIANYTSSSSAPAGPIVPLAQIATIRRSVGALWVNRQSQQPSVTLSFNTAPGVSIGEAVNAIHVAEQQVSLPPTIATYFTGTAQLFEDAQKGQIPLIVAAILTIYIVLGVLYESFIHPITILSGLPSAGLGALIALQAFGLDLSVIAIIGILLLVGLVKKNAIMMVDFAIERRNSGMDALSAIREAAVIRFRPIIMTTLAAILGSLPVALGTGSGSELRQPLGIAVVGGLCLSQVLTLFITPVVYYYLDKVDSFISGRNKRAVQSTETMPEGGAIPEAAE